jgi:hypothetical protein
MKSITSFLRIKGYALGEIRQLLQELEPTGGHCATELGGGSALARIVEQMRESPELAHLARGRASLKEAGIHPVKEFGHTLKVPLSGKEGVSEACVCFTRIAEDSWVYYVDQRI